MPSLLGRVFDHLGEQLAGAAHEGDALGVFIGARAFTHEDQRRVFVAHAENDFVAAFVQAAAMAIADIFEDCGRAAPVQAWRQLLAPGLWAEAVRRGDRAF